MANFYALLINLPTIRTDRLPGVIRLLYFVRMPGNLAAGRLASQRTFRCCLPKTSKCRENKVRRLGSVSTGIYGGDFYRIRGIG